VTPVDDEIRTFALSLLAQVAEWERPPGAWEEISGVLEAVAAAVDRGDDEAADGALAELELQGPYMLTPAYSTPQDPDSTASQNADSPDGVVVAPKPVPIPLALRERVNTLVHRLGPTPEGGR
jgi:hypothetical protein